jgi:cytochrome c-type biogenesis protein
MLELSLIGVLSAFGAGMISFLSPCVLPLVPGYLSYMGYLSYIGGYSVGFQDQENAQSSLRETLQTLALSFNFVLGFSTVFIAFGASATTLGQWLMAYRYETNIIGGIIVIIFGVLISGLIRIHWLQKEFRYFGELPGGRGLSAYLLGLAFAFGWTPVTVHSRPCLTAPSAVGDQSRIAGDCLQIVSSTASASVRRLGLPGEH